MKGARSDPRPRFFSTAVTFPQKTRFAVPSILLQEAYLDSLRHIYREAWHGNHPKSVALRREVDYHTGLSFSTTRPTERPYFVYEVRALTEAGYTVDFNGDQPVVSRWQPEWVLRDSKGALRRYNPDHVSIYHERAYWHSWYEAEQNAGRDGSTPYSMSFYELAVSYEEV